MRTCLITSLFFVALGSTVWGADIEPVKDWKLVWSDEFNKDGQPNPQIWTYESGLVRNKEEQHYVKDSRKNARVEKGCLVLEAHKEDVVNPNFDAQAKPADWQKSRKSSHYSSASVTTDGLKEIQYGKVEVRAKLPAGKGSWPAIWLLGTNRSQFGWPTCGEIDVMEYVTSAPNTTHATLHWKTKGDKHTSKGVKTKNDSLVSDFHVYGMEWDPETITFTLDGKAFGSIPLEQATNDKGENPFRKPFYLLLNFALGGSWGGPVQGDDFPRQYLIDYVRVFEKKDNDSK